MVARHCVPWGDGQWEACALHRCQPAKSSEEQEGLRAELAEHSVASPRGETGAQKFQETRELTGLALCPWLVCE